MIDFFRRFFSSKTKEVKLALPLETKTKPYEFNEFEEFILKNMKDGRLSAIKPLLDKGFEIGPELKSKMYEAFWIDFAPLLMNYSKEITKPSILQKDKLSEFMIFMFENKIFDMDFIDVLNENSIHLKPNVQEVVGKYKRAISSYKKLADSHNDSIRFLVGIHSLTENKLIESKSLSIAEPVYSLSSDEKRALAAHIHSLYHKTNDSSLYYPRIMGSNIFLTALSPNVYNLRFKKNNYSKNTLSSLAMTKHFVYKEDYLNILKAPAEFKGTVLPGLKELVQEYEKYYRSNYDFETMKEKQRKMGFGFVSFIHLESKKEDLMSIMFFEYYLEYLIKNKNVTPTELFNTLLEKNGDVSKLSLVLLQNYPEEITAAITSKNGEKVEKIFEEYVEHQAEAIRYLMRIHSSKDERTTEYAECLKALEVDKYKLKDILKSSEDNSIYEKFEYSKLNISLDKGDFVSFAKLKEFPEIIVLKLEHIKNNIDLLKKASLDIENQNFVNNSVEKVTNILQNYLSLEELTENISSQEIDKLLIGPLVEMGNSLEKISREYQEKKVLELSQNSKQMERRVKIA